MGLLETAEKHFVVFVFWKVRFKLLMWVEWSVRPELKRTLPVGGGREAVQIACVVCSDLAGLSESFRTRVAMLER